MSQSSTIAFFLMAGFLIYITARGELAAYAATVGIGNAVASNNTNTFNNTTATNQQQQMSQGITQANQNSFQNLYGLFQ